MKCKFCNSDIIAVKSYDRYKVFCNHACSAKYNNQFRKKEKLCLYCKKVRIGKNSKKFCSKLCANDYHYREFIESWLAGRESGLTSAGNLVRTIRKWLSEQSNESCYVCSTQLSNPYSGKSILEVHHVNGDYTDNSKDNLQLLCPNCHAMTETHRALNAGGKGRKYSNTRGKLEIKQV